MSYIVFLFSDHLKDLYGTEIIYIYICIFNESIKVIAILQYL